MCDQKKNRVYIGIVSNDSFDSKALVCAQTPEKAREKVLKKYQDGLGTLFREDDISIKPFRAEDI